VNGAATGLKTPPETSPTTYREGGPLHEQESPYQSGPYSFGSEYQSSMNQVAPYPPQDVHQQHMATTHAHPPTSGPGAPMHYAQYQAPMVQNHPYSSSPAPYAQASYSYASYPAAPATSSMSNIPVASHIGQPPQLNSKLNFFYIHY
jgi:hypothetical protein